VLKKKKAKKNKGETDKPKPTDKPTDKPSDMPPFVGPGGPLDKSILTCSDKSIPTFCQSPDASIDCNMLRAKMNECIALADPARPAEFVVYDPNNCGDGGTAAISGCGDGSGGFCRTCGRGNEPAILPCATGFYSEYYEPRNEQEKEEANERSVEQTISDMLAVPVRIDCDKYYAILEGFQNGSSNGQDINGVALGFCALDAESFEFNVINENFGNGRGVPIQNCPPQFAADYAANWLNANYQTITTTNSRGETFPKPGFPELAVGEIPALLPAAQYKDKCNGLALGQEVNIFDAGEISTFALTAKTMAERMLRPATFGIDAGLSNCVNVSFVSETESNEDAERCKAYSASTIDNPFTWENATDNVLPDNNIQGEYVYHVPSAARPETTLEIGQRTQRVAKQMHGKGQSVG
jgi:hypothetical protein